MSLYRCAACGSPNVMTDTQSDGISYNYKKGIMGTALLGSGGAVAGIESNTSHVFKCPDCGITLTYPMSQEIKAAIDAGVNSLSSRDNPLVSYLPWSYLIQKYPNIESGNADFQLNLNRQRAANRSEYLRELSKEIIEDIRTMLSEISILDTPEDNTSELQVNWEKVSKEFIVARQKEYEQIEKEILGAQQKDLSVTTQSIQNTISKLQASNQHLSDEKSKLNAEFGTLGIFKVKRKKEIKERLSMIDTLVQSNNSQIENENRNLANAKTDIEKKSAARLATEKLNIDRKYGLTKSPLEHKQRLMEFKKYMSESSNGFYVVTVYKVLEGLIKYSQEKGVFILDSMLHGDEFEYCNDDVYMSDDISEISNAMLAELAVLYKPKFELSHFSSQRTSATLLTLRKDGLIERTDAHSVPISSNIPTRGVWYYTIK